MFLELFLGRPIFKNTPLSNHSKYQVVCTCSAFKGMEREERCEQRDAQADWNARSGHSFPPRPRG